MKLTISRSSMGRVVALAVVAALAFTIGGALTAFGQNDNVYTACLDNGGTLNQVKLNAGSPARCSGNQTPVSWNQQGPAGAPGPQGDKGDPGTPGSNGLSHAYVVHAGSQPFNNGNVYNQASATVASLDNLPAGSYVVTAVESASANNNLEGFSLSCTLTPGGATSAQDDTGILSVHATNLTITDVVTLAAPGSITVNCSATNGSSSTGAVITAIAVDTVN